MKCIFLVAIFNYCISQSLAKDGLAHFLERRKINKLSVTVLYNKSNTVWYEYKYYFLNLESKNKLVEPQVFNIGIYCHPDISFDCQYVYNKSDNISYEGYSVEIIKILRDIRHFRSEFIVINSSESIASLLLSRKVDGILYNKDTNVIGNLSDIIQLYPVIFDKYVLIYKPSELKFTKDIFILTFAGYLWFVFLIILVILAICLRISTAYYSVIKPKYKMWNWVEITLWTIAAACQQGLSYTPNGFPSRCIFLLGYVTAYLLYTGFAAGITSILLQHDRKFDLTIDDISNMKLQIIKFKCIFDDLSHSVEVNNLDVLFLHLNNQSTVGVAPKILIEKYFAKYFNYREVSQYTVSILPHTYTEGLVILKNNSLKDQLNYWLTKIKETGLDSNLLQKTRERIPNSYIVSGYSSVGFEHIGSAIIIMLSGILGAIVFFLIELIFAFYKQKRAQKISFKKAKQSLTIM